MFEINFGGGMNMNESVINKKMKQIVIIDRLNISNDSRKKEDEILKFYDSLELMEFRCDLKYK